MSDKNQNSNYVYTVILLALTYSQFHATRISWGYCSPTVENNVITEEVLGKLDFFFMIMYGIGIIFNGWLADKVN